MAVEIRLRCRWCGRPDVAGCDCEASQEIAHLKQQRDEAVRCSEESAEIMRRARARLTRERDEARGQSEARGTHVRCLDAEVRSLRTRAEQAEAERGEAHGLALDYKGQAERLRIELDRLVAKCREMGWPQDAIRAALRGEEGES